MTTTRTRARLAATAAIASAAVLVAAPAWAHVEPTPAAVEAGTTGTISFGVEHGCEDSPTTMVEVQIPDGVTDVEPGEAPDGWTGEVADGVLTFRGPAQPSHDGFDLGLTATFPADAGSVSFPLIQTCEDGSIDWIEPTVEGQEEPEHPAPTVQLTASAPTDEELAGGHEEGEEGEEHEEGSETTTTAATETTEAGSTETTAAPATTAADGSSIEQAEDDADTGDSDDGTSNTGLIVGGAIAAVVVLGGGAAYLLRRNAAEGADGTERPTTHDPGAGAPPAP